MASFRESYPIDFDLYDKDTQNVLYIEDTSDQTLTLQIRNASTQTIQLDDLTANPISNSNYHFALRFRPGTLSSVTLGGAPNGIQLAAATAQNWEMLLVPADPSGMDVIYLKSKSASLGMAPDTLQTLVFEKVGAHVGQGARGTRVELLYTNMTYSGGSAISSNWEIHLSINYPGKPNLPLHIGFLGDNGVFNDGTTQNALKLRFSNTLVYNAANPDLSELNFLQDADETLRSKIILSFELGTAAAEWALGDSNDINAITIAQPAGWAITKDTSGQNPEWTLYPNIQNQVLYGRNHPGGASNPGHFDLDISNIITNFPTGHTHLHIRYENIPGYWDGQFKLTLEKRPLHYHGGNVGIGTTTSPSEKLSVAGVTSSQGLRIPGIYTFGQGTSGIEMEVPVNSFNAIRGYNGNQHIGTIHFFDNNWGSGAADKSAGSVNISGNIATTIGPWNNPIAYFKNNGGNVGIGTTDPQAPLSIAGNGKENNPDDVMHITNDCILFGGGNNGKQADSAQISAGKHHANSLNIVGMSSGTNANTRRVDMWAEGGFNVRGRGVEEGGIKLINDTGNQFAMWVHSNHSLRFKLNSSNHGATRQIYWDGDANWDFSSDERLKTNIENEKEILTRLLQLDVKNYNWKDSPGRKLKSIGFIAQDVQPLFPALVGETMEEDEEETTLTLKYGAFGVLAVGAIKELKQETDTIIAKQARLIKDLLTRVAALEAKQG